MKKLPSLGFAAIAVDLVWFNFGVIKSRPLFSHLISFAITVRLSGKIAITL
jgi:hypothetical protein